MADTVGRTVVGARRRRALDAFGSPQTGTRHPLVAAAMVLPFVTQASSVAGMLGR